MQISRNKKLPGINIKLNECGLKATLPRIKVVEALQNSKKPLSAAEIYKLTKKYTDRASIYRSLRVFTECGITDEINLNEGFLRYEISGKKHHHHIKCDNCGAIKCIDICIKLDVEKLTGYRINKHSIEFNGVCPNCLKNYS